MASDPQRVQQVFLAAVELADAAARSALLERECGDGELRDRVEALLAAHDESGSFLDATAARTGQYTPGATGTAQAGAAVVAHGPGTVLAGRYQLVEAIGEGGMGAVWMARQTEPVRRPVAVKLVKAGMDSKAILARFEA